MHTATGLVERTIQTLKNLLLANLEDGISLTESLNRALHVMRFTVHTGKAKHRLKCITDGNQDQNLQT